MARLARLALLTDSDSTRLAVRTRLGHLGQGLAEHSEG